MNLLCYIISRVAQKPVLHHQSKELPELNPSPDHFFVPETPLIHSSDPQSPQLLDDVLDLSQNPVREEKKTVEPKFPITSRLNGATTMTVAPGTQYASSEATGQNGPLVWSWRSNNTMDGLFVYSHRSLESLTFVTCNVDDYLWHFILGKLKLAFDELKDNKEYTDYIKEAMKFAHDEFMTFKSTVDSIPELPEDVVETRKIMERLNVFPVFDDLSQRMWILKDQKSEKAEWTSILGNSALRYYSESRCISLGIRPAEITNDLVTAGNVKYMRINEIYSKDPKIQISNTELSNSMGNKDFEGGQQMHLELNPHSLIIFANSDFWENVKDDQVITIVKQHLKEELNLDVLVQSLMDLFKSKSDYERASVLVLHRPSTMDTPREWTVYNISGDMKNAGDVSTVSPWSWFSSDTNNTGYVMDDDKATCFSLMENKNGSYLSDQLKIHLGLMETMDDRSIQDALTEGIQNFYQLRKAVPYLVEISERDMTSDDEKFKKSLSAMEFMHDHSLFLNEVNVLYDLVSSGKPGLFVQGWNQLIEVVRQVLKNQMSLVFVTTVKEGVKIRIKGHIGFLVLYENQRWNDHNRVQYSKTAINEGDMAQIGMFIFEHKIKIMIIISSAFWKHVNSKDAIRFIKEKNIDEPMKIKELLLSTYKSNGGTLSLSMFVIKYK